MRCVWLALLFVCLKASAATCPVLLSQLTAKGRIPVEDIDEQALTIFQGATQPIRRRKQVAKVDVSERVAKAQAALDELGVEYRDVTGKKVDPDYNMRLVPRLDREIKKKRIKGKHALGIAKLWEVTAPGKGEADPEGPALTHPDLPRYMRLMNKLGSRLLVDPSLGFAGAGASYVHWKSTPNSYIALSPRSTWLTFKHELNHLIWRKFVDEHLPEARERLADDPDANFLPKKSLKQLDPEEVERMREMLLEELPDLAINETLAVEASLRAKREAGLEPGRYDLKKSRYALRHQLHELLDIATDPDGKGLTQAQKLGLFRAWTEFIIGRTQAIEPETLQREFARCQKARNCGPTGVRLAREAISRQ